MSWQYVLDLFHLAIQDGCGPLRLECSIYMYPSVKAAALEPSGVVLSQGGHRWHRWDVHHALPASSRSCWSTGCSCDGPKLIEAGRAGSQLHWQQGVQATDASTLAVMSSIANGALHRQRLTWPHPDLTCLLTSCCAMPVPDRSLTTGAPCCLAALPPHPTSKWNMMQSLKCHLDAECAAWLPAELALLPTRSQCVCH